MTLFTASILTEIVTEREKDSLATNDRLGFESTLCSFFE